ncbi:MAG: HD domain-containing protein [Bacteroidota bacterium]
MSSLKILNDPIYGIITMPNDLVMELISHPYFQRLRRIRQLGMTHLVYPGANHTRFHHALGAMHLMHLAIEVLKSKGNIILATEEEAVIIAILLHDIGHGPFSHALEDSIASGIKHEELSLLMMDKLNSDFSGRLSLALKIFRDEYPKKFLHQLVSSQLDMDRLDYLCRDSFFTGVSEGVISQDRIIKMLDVHDDQLAIEAKGIYSIEKFLVARRLMYWQVYLHKTVVSAEGLLINILKRARVLTEQGHDLFGTPAFKLFLANNFSKADFVADKNLLDTFALLDDSDITSSVKVWCTNPDAVLSQLCKAIINRNLFKIIIREEPFTAKEITAIKEKVKQDKNLDDEECEYFVIEDKLINNAYSSRSDKINILFKDGTVKDIAEAADTLNITAMSEPVEKYYVCYPKY